MWETFKRTLLGERGSFNVWRFTPHQRMIGWRGAAACHYRSDAPADAAAAFTARLGTIEHAGLIEFVPHLLEADSLDAEVIHPYGIGESDSLEDQLGRAASDAAYALLTPTSESWANTGHVVPVLRHLSHVQMVGIARLRYHAQTRAAAAWLANLYAAAARYLPLYSDIVNR